MKQTYESLLLEVITFQELDVITASNGAFTEQGFDFGEYFGGAVEGGDLE